MEPIGGVNDSLTNQNSLFQSNNDNTLGKEDFLTLLVSQLENQDPLNPKDPSEFVSQLAQFSSLEQLISVNKNLEVIQNYQSSLESSLAIKYFGKSIVANGNAIEHESGTPSKIIFSLPEEASAVNVNVYDQSGNFIDSVEMSSLSAGKQAIEWDGTDGNMNLLPSGIYLFDVQAVDFEQNKIPATTYTEGQVTGAKYNNGKVFLTLEEQIVPLESIIEVKKGPDEEAIETTDEEIEIVDEADG